MRRYRLIFFITVFAVLLFSCRGDFGVIVPNFKKYDTTGFKETEVHVRHNFNSDSLIGFTTLAEEFNNTNDYGITVILAEDDVTGMDKTDVVFCTPSEASAMLHSGRSVELSPLIDHPQWGLVSGRRSFYPAARRQTEYFDFALKVSSLPVLMNAGVVAVNYDLLETYGPSRFPDSWFGLNMLMYKAEKRQQPFFGMQMDPDTVVSIINSRGGSVLRPPGLAYSFFNPVANRTLRYLRSRENRGTLSADRTNYLNQTLFAFEKLPASFVSIDGIGYYSDLIEVTAPGLNWGIDLLPDRRPGDVSVVNCVHTAAVMEGRPEYELASWLFIKWLVETPQQIKLAESTSLMPVVREASVAIMENPDSGFSPQWLDAIKLVDNSRQKTVPSLYDYSCVSKKFEQVLSRIHEGNLVWLETFRLERDIRKNRRNLYNGRAGE